VRLALSKGLSVVVLVAVTGLLGGCVKPAPAEPASMATSAPPWSAPRDAVSHIDAAGLEHLPLNDTSDPHVLTVTVTVDGAPVTLPAHIGVDRVRAVQAAVHTHDTTGQVWLEGRGNRTVTLGQFFQLWGVRFDRSCLGASCGGVTVTADGEPVTGDPRDVVLRQVKRTVNVSATS